MPDQIPDDRRTVPGTRKPRRQDDDARGRERWALGGTTLVLNVGSFLFLVMVARTADPAIFGALAALASIALVFETPASSLQALVERAVRTAHTGPNGAPPTGAAAGGLLVDTTAWGVVVCAALLGLSPLTKWFFHLPDLTSALLLGAYALPVAVGVVPRGVLLGQGCTRSLGASVIAGTAVRLVLGTVLVHGGAGLTGALAAMVAGETISATMSLLAARRGLGPDIPLSSGDPAIAEGNLVAEPQAGGQVALRWRDATGLVVAFGGYWLFGAIDMVLARHWLSAQASGWYAGALTAAQVAMLLPQAAAAVIFPRLLGEDNNADRRLTLATACGAVACVGFAVATAVSLLAEPAVTTLFDDSYRRSAAVVGLLTFAGALLGLITVLLHYHLARGWQVAANLCWPGLLVATVGIAIWHRDMTEVAVVTVVATSAVCAAMMAVALARSERPGPELVERAMLSLADAEIDLTVVIPYYNPGELLVPTVGRVLETLRASRASYEVIAVSDGATDGSDRQLDLALGDQPELTNVVLARNQGKGAALRVGLARGRGRYLGFIDADGDLDPLLLESFMAMVKLYSPDIILGSKRHPLSEVEYPWLRRVYSWGYQQVVRVGFRLNIRDTQTGIKLVRRDVLAAVLPRMIEKRFAFDLELFVIARRLGYKRFLEAPIRLRHQFTSTVSASSVRRMMVDTLAIWYRLRLLHYYDTDVAPATPLGERLRIEPVVLRGSAPGPLRQPPGRAATQGRA